MYELCLLLIIINPVLHFVGGCCDRQSKILTLLVLFWQQKRQDLRGIFNYHNVHIWEDENFRFQQEFSIILYADIVHKYLTAPSEPPQWLTSAAYW